MKRIDPASVPELHGSSYPAPFDGPCRDQVVRRLGRHAGLTQFGVNLTEIGPGAWSSQRHWHSHEDEFIMVVEGELVLVTDTGEELLAAGDCAAFPKGAANGHHLVNRSDRPARVLEIGTAYAEDRCTYSDIDMLADEQGYRHRDGTPYPK